VAKEVLERIAALYAIEEEIRGHSAEERRAVRTERGKPLLESLKKWFEETLGKLSRKSDITRAIRYALDRWDALTRYCCFRPQELSLRRFGCRGRTRSSALRADRDRKAQRPEPGSVPA